MKTMDRIGKKVVGTCIATAMAASFSPMAAFAASMDDESEGQAGTRMTLQYIGSISSSDFEEPDGPWSGLDDDTKDKIEQGDVDDEGNALVHYAVPTTMPMAFRSNGKLICASGNAYKVDNKSVIQLKMTDVTLSPGADYTINGIGSGTDAKLTVKFNAGTSAYDEDTAIMPKSANTLDASITIPTSGLALAFGGELEEPVDVEKFNTPKEVGSLTWHISPNGASA